MKSGAENFSLIARDSERLYLQVFLSDECILQISEFFSRNRYSSNLCTSISLSRDIYMYIGLPHAHAVRWLGAGKYLLTPQKYRSQCLNQRHKSLGEDLNI